MCLPSVSLCFQHKHVCFSRLLPPKPATSLLVKSFVTNSFQGMDPSEPHGCSFSFGMSGSSCGITWKSDRAYLQPLVDIPRNWGYVFHLFP